MIKKETLEVLSEIHSYWNHFQVNQERIDKWHVILIDFEFDVIMANLLDYVKISSYAPTVADLIKLGEKRDKYVPSAEDTKKYLAERDKLTEKLRNDPDVLEAKKKADEEIARLFGKNWREVKRC